MIQLFNNKDKLTFNLFIILLIATLTMYCDASDSQCCRKRINCYNCDSRTDPKCGDIFNKTGAPMEFCDDLCVKLRYKHGDNYYFIRSCADTLKTISLKKTEVCYTTRTKNSGHLCFCEADLCNNSNKFKFSKFVYTLIAAAVNYIFYFS